MLPRIGVLALQGAFREHRRALERCGATVCEVRQLKDMDGIAAMIIPGGESTTIGKLLTEEGMMAPLRQRILDGMPVYGSCAGLILLCREIEDRPEQPRLGVLDAAVRRNAFGRQVDSFETDLALEGVADSAHAVFIRAPLLTRTGPDVTVLARVQGYAVAVRQNTILGTSFHPELTDDLTVHRYFLNMCAEASA